MMTFLKIQFTEEEQQTIAEFSHKIDLENSEIISQYGVYGQRKVADLSENILNKIQEIEEKSAQEVFEKLEKCICNISKKSNVEKVMIQLDRISDELLNIQNQLMKNFLQLKQLSEKNVRIYKELTMYLVAGEEKLKQVPGSSERDREHFKRRLYDLEVSRTICVQMDAQMQLIQNSNVKLVEKIQKALNETIPLGKNRLTMLLKN